MPNNIRYELIKQIENERSSRVICYLTGDRKGFETKIGMDVFAYFYELLTKIGHTSKIDLFVHSTGGAIMAGWGIVNLIREFCDTLNVLIPFKAHSAATLIALGADEIVMGPLGQLSPVDPSVSSPYNPAAPGPQPKGTMGILPVSGEDVIGYFNLARDEAGLKKSGELIEVFKILAEKIHPITLGNVFRARNQIELLIKGLLRFHSSETEIEEKSKEIISTLTTNLYSHDYIISRTEAKDKLNLKIADDVPQSLIDMMWNLYKQYEDEMEINRFFHPESALAQNPDQEFTFSRAIIESTEKTFVYQTKKVFKAISVPSAPGGPITVHIQENILSDGWVVVNELESKEETDE